MFVILQWRPCYTITLGSQRGLGGMVFGPLGSVLSDSSYWLSSVYCPFENFWILLHRDDLHTPSSPYFPVLAQYGEEGPPPMLQERFFTVISQLFEHVRNQFFFFFLFFVGLLKFGGIYLFDLGVWLNRKRIIRCGGEVADDMANMIVAQLLYLDAVDPNKVCILSSFPASFCEVNIFSCGWTSSQSNLR